MKPGGPQTALTFRLSEPPYFDDTATRRCVLEGLNASEANMMGVPVGAIDHHVGLSGQLVMQAEINQAADDR